MMLNVIRLIALSCQGVNSGTAQSTMVPILSQYMHISRTAVPYLNCIQGDESDKSNKGREWCPKIGILPEVL